MTNKITVGDKVKVVNSSEEYCYTNGATGIVLEIDGTAVVQFTDGKYKKGFGGDWYVRLEELEVISNESKTQTKKEKEMEDQSVKLKQGVYAVIETGSKSVVDVFTNRGAARYWMQGMKQEFPECSYKLAKLAVDKWIR